MVAGVDTVAVNGPRVLAMLGEFTQGSSVTFTRLTGPFAKLRNAGYPVAWMPYDMIRAKAARREGMSTYDVYILARAVNHDGRIVDMIKRLQAAGKKVIWETDDDYTNEFRQVTDGDPQAVVQECDAITVSTPYLREQTLKHTPGLPAYLLVNTIDFGFWSKVTKSKRVIPGPAIGLVGTKTHYEDWKQLGDSLHRIAAEYPQAQFVLGGLHPDYLMDLPNLHCLQPCEYINYPDMIAQFDIGLAPLDPDDNFNKSKSAIKALEYWAAGNCVVASKCSVYDAVMDPQRGFSASNPDEWYQAIKAYLDDFDMAQEKAKNGIEWTWRNRNMDTRFPFWYNVYEEVFRR